MSNGAIKIDLRGVRFGRLTAVEPGRKSHNGGGRYWVCQCDCGGKNEVKQRYLRAGLTKSCGCLRRSSDAERSRLSGYEVRRSMGLCIQCGNPVTGRLTCESCASRNRKSVAAYQGKKRAFKDSLKDAPCADCGGRFPPVCMDFDHRPGATKVADPGVMAIKHSREAFLAEIAKCDLVCANCRRIRTHVRRQVVGE